MATSLFQPDRQVTDCYYVISTTQWGRHLLTGTPVDITAKGRLVKIHAEPVVEERTIHINKVPVDVLVPMVTVSDVDYPDVLRVVIYDEHYVVKGENHQLINQLTAEAQRRPKAYDPLTRLCTY